MMMNFKMNIIHYNSFKLTLILMMIFSSSMIMMSSSWFSSWIFLEINMMSFIPLMNNKSIPNKTINSMIKYFIVQAFSSSLFLLSIILMNMIFENYNETEIYNLFNNLIKMMITISILIKLGAAPFHWWLPQVVKKLNWNSMFLLLTWQKLAPLMILYQLNYNNWIINCSAILSMIAGSFMGTNQLSLKMILSYSSINHLGWMLINLITNNFNLILYWTIYTIINFSIILLINKLNINYLNQLFKLYNKNMYHKLLLMSMFLSLGGMPPFLGFLPKLFTLLLAMKNMMFIELMVMIFTALITLKYYINLMLPAFTMMNSNFKPFKNKTMFFSTNFMIIFINSTIMLLIISMNNYIPT